MTRVDDLVDGVITHIPPAICYFRAEKSFEQSPVHRPARGIISFGPFAAPIAVHLRNQLVQRLRAQTGELLAYHLERHPDHPLAAFAPDPRITVGFELADGAGVTHGRIKALSISLSGALQRLEHDSKPSWSGDRTDARCRCRPSLLLRLEQVPRSTMEDHVHRIKPVGA